jgi:hypothetical protein
MTKVTEISNNKLVVTAKGCREVVVSVAAYRRSDDSDVVVVVAEDFHDLEITFKEHVIVKLLTSHERATLISYSSIIDCSAL